MLESFFNSVAGFRPATLLIKNCNTGFSCEYYEIFKNNFFYRTPLVTASVLLFFSSMLNFGRALENLRTMDDFNFTNFLSDREMGCSTEGASYCCFRKTVSKNFRKVFQKVLLITFISN